MLNSPGCSTFVQVDRELADDELGAGAVTVGGGTTAGLMTDVLMGVGTPLAVGPEEGAELAD